MTVTKQTHKREIVTFAPLCQLGCYSKQATDCRSDRSSQWQSVRQLWTVLKSIAIVCVILILIIVCAAELRIATKPRPFNTAAHTHTHPLIVRVRVLALARVDCRHKD